MAEPDVPLMLLIHNNREIERKFVCVKYSKTLEDLVFDYLEPQTIENFDISNVELFVSQTENGPWSKSDNNVSAGALRMFQNKFVKIVYNGPSVDDTSEEGSGPKTEEPNILKVMMGMQRSYTYLPDKKQWVFL